jgi:toxin HigB-1
MIKSFKDADTHQLALTGKNRRWANIAKVALRKLDQLDSAASLESLKEPPANHLEALKKDRKGQHSIRINDQFRICFIWKENGAYDVEIVDYH